MIWNFSFTRLTLKLVILGIKVLNSSGPSMGMNSEFKRFFFTAVKWFLIFSFLGYVLSFRT